MLTSSAFRCFALHSALIGNCNFKIRQGVAKRDMPLSRIDAICRALQLDFADLARRVADARPLPTQLTQEQKRTVVADKKLLGMRSWEFEAFTALRR
jgi:hypothetical protein